MKCAPFPPGTSSPVNLCSSPAPPGPSPTVSHLWASPQHSRAQALCQTAPHSCGRVLGSSSPGFHQCSGKQPPGRRGRAAPRSTEDFWGAGECSHGGRRWAGQQEPLLASLHGREKKKKAFAGVPFAATKYLKKELSAEVGSHGNVSSAVSPREHTGEGVALLYLLKLFPIPMFSVSHL